MVCNIRTIISHSVCIKFFADQENLNPECICDVVNSLQQEEANERRKQSRLKEVNKKRNLESLQKDAMKRGKEFEKKVKMYKCSTCSDLLT